MASTQKTTYFIIALRSIKDSESEADFIFGDETLVIDAVEKCSLENLTKSESKIKEAFPKHQIMVTYLPLFESFGLLSKMIDLEKELVESGEIAHVDNDQSRLRKVFDWECKHNTAIHSGNC